MKIDQWEATYIDQFVSRGLTVDDGKMAFDAEENHDFQSNPRDAANEELSYWAN